MGLLIRNTKPVSVRVPLFVSITHSLRPIWNIVQLIGTLTITNMFITLKEFRDDIPRSCILLHLSSDAGGKANTYSGDSDESEVEHGGIISVCIRDE